MNIPVGSILVFTKNPNNTVKVISERKVEYKNQETYLTPLTQKLLNINYSIDPTKYWYYKNKQLIEYY
jgi:hypothetical protein